MIVSYLLDLIYTVISTVLGVIRLPAMPDEVSVFMGEFISYIDLGIDVLGSYFDLNYIKTLLIIFISVILAIDLYHMVLWVLKKIPLLNIE